MSHLYDGLIADVVKASVEVFEGKGSSTSDIGVVLAQNQNVKVIEVFFESTGGHFQDSILFNKSVGICEVNVYAVSSKCVDRKKINADTGDVENVVDRKVSADAVHRCFNVEVPLSENRHASLSDTVDPFRARCEGCEVLQYRNLFCHVGRCGRIQEEIGARKSGA